MAAVPSLQKFWNKNEKRGLHVFHIECQDNDIDAVERFVRARKMTFPNVRKADGNFGKYATSNLPLPHAWVIGVNGTVIWEGAKGYKPIVEAELKKVRYPGLGRNDIAADAKRSAEAFGKGTFGKAMSEAKKQLGKTEDSEAKADLEYIVARVDAFVKRKQATVEEAKGERQFGRAVAIMDELSKRMKGSPIGDTLKSDLKKFRKDKACKSGLAAEAAWPAVYKMLGDEKRTNSQNKKLLQGFIKKHEGTKEAEKAFE
ncbi:MAG: hypothetical protein AAF581_20590, partial [Planctomycetota bacterium]